MTEVLNTEAILGFDFLEQNCCTINAQHRILHSQGRAIPLQRKGRGTLQKINNPIPLADVILPASLQIPPLSEIEILADTCIPEDPQRTTVYLVEPRVQDTDTAPTTVTTVHALVRPIMHETQSQLPVYSLPLCLINLSSELLKLHKGIKLATGRADGVH